MTRIESEVRPYDTTWTSKSRSGRPFLPAQYVGAHLTEEFSHFEALQDETKVKAGTGDLRDTCK